MEKKWTLTIVAAEWNGTGFDYEQIIENTETNAPDWDTYGLAEWINGEKSAEDLAQIIENADVHDVKYTATIYDEYGNTTYHESMWESDAAKFALGV